MKRKSRAAFSVAFIERYIPRKGLRVKGAIGVVSRRRISFEGVNSDLFSRDKMV